MPKKEKYAIGVDLGGTNVKIGIVSHDGKITEKTSLETEAEGGPESVISQIKKGMREVLNGNKLKISGIGIGSPGIISVKKGIVEDPPNLPGWKKVSLGKIIEKEFKIRTYIENDANAAAIGELMFGSGKKLDSFIMVTLGTGVGGGIVFNRKLYRGEIGAAGEIGHTTISFDGQQCNCGSYGCLETFLGNHYIVKSVKNDLPNHKDSKIWKFINNDLNKLTPLIIDQALQNDDRFAKKIVKDLGTYLGTGLASVANAFDISTFIIGGGVAGFGKPLFDAVCETAASRVMKPLKKRIKIKPAKLKNDAGIKGASALVFYKS